MDILTSFRIFGRVAETGSFSAVARERGMSQPAISRQVAALEEYYGVRLIHRTTRKSALTEEGKALLPHVHAIITSLDAAQDSVQPAQKSISGVVRITVPVALGIFLASRVHSLLDAHPHLSFDISVGEGFGDMIEEGYDLAVTIGAPPDSTFVARRIGATHRVLVAAPAYLARAGEPKNPEDLAAHQCIAYPTEANPKIWRFDGPDGSHSVPVSARFHANSSEVVRRAVMSGLGIGMLPEIAVGHELGAGTLRRIITDYKPTEFPIHILYPSRSNLPARTRAVINFLVSEFEHNPYLVKSFVDG